nr:MAG TPA: hypothetical protein [Caudoviricetes sp.]
MRINYKINPDFGQAFFSETLIKCYTLSIETFRGIK